MTDEFDYRELYKEEPIRFRGMQGCGSTDVKPMPKRRPAKPRQFYGLGQNLKHCDVPDSKFNREELDRGTQVELEHTDDRATARCIAKTHLLESPFYYEELEKMERRLEKKTPKFLWKHTGGGCSVGPEAEGQSHPCDDTYENIITGEEVWVDTTAKAHFKMPSKAKSMEIVWKRSGVRKR